MGGGRWWGCPPWCKPLVAQAWAHSIMGWQAIKFVCVCVCVCLVGPMIGIDLALIFSSLFPSFPPILTNFPPQVLPIVNQLLQYGSVTRAVVGLDIIFLDALTATKEREATGVDLLPSASSSTRYIGGGEGEDSPYLCGLLVSRVAKGKPGEEGGFKEGDVILEINGTRQLRKGSFFQSLGPVYEKGKVMKCKVWRPLGPRAGGKIITLALKPVPRR